MLILLSLILHENCSGQFTCAAPRTEANSSIEGTSFDRGAWRSLSIAISLDGEALHKTSCLIDTGAKYTLISNTFAHRHPSYFMCHNHLIQGVFGVGAQMVGYLYICFTALYVTRNVKSSAVVLIPSYTDTTFSSKHKCILGFSTLEATYSVIDFRCGHISFVKGEFKEESFLGNVDMAMSGLGITMKELVPYDLLSSNITENVETIVRAGKGNHIIITSIGHLGRMSSGMRGFP